jgi:hypothetical protein
MNPRDAVATTVIFVPAILLAASAACAFTFIRRRWLRVTSGITLAIALSFVCASESALQVAYAACGDGCMQVKCFEGIDGTYIVIEDDICHKIVRRDPGNSNLADHRSRRYERGGTVGSTSRRRVEFSTCNEPSALGNGRNGVRERCDEDVYRPMPRLTR